MPWTGPEFKRKHNKKLSSSQAKHAARQATAMLRRGVPEGEAIATANKDVHKRRRSNNRRKWRPTQQ